MPYFIVASFNDCGFVSILFSLGGTAVALVVPTFKPPARDRNTEAYNIKNERFKAWAIEYCEDPGLADTGGLHFGN